MTEGFRRTTAELIDELRESGIHDERLLSVMARTPRQYFVPDESLDIANRDLPVPIPQGQVSPSPSHVARMIEALHIKKGDAVLEIGTGFGYQTAILARLAHRVYSMERFEDLVAQARANLRTAGIDELENTEIFEGDGTIGLLEYAPFDGIIVSAASPHVPGPLIFQLIDGGRLVQPIGPGGNEQVIVFKKQNGILIHEKVLAEGTFTRLEGAFEDAERLGGTRRAA